VRARIAWKGLDFGALTLLVGHTVYEKTCFSRL